MRLMIMLFFILGWFGLHAEKTVGKEFCLKVSKLDFELASRLKVKWGLQLYGHGGDFGQGIQSITPSYMLNCTVKINQAREIILDALEHYVNAINQDVLLRPYLVEYPFNMNRLTLGITFYPMPMSQYGSEFVTHVLFYNGNLSYSAYDDFKTPKRYTDIKIETYEEALKLRSGDHHD